METKHRTSKEKSKSQGPSGVYWQKVREEAVETEGGVFKNRKAVSRNSNLRTVRSGGKSDNDWKTEKEHVPQRANTVLGLEDYFDDSEGAKKLKSLNAKASLQELKRSTLWLKNGPRRNCVSALGENKSQSLLTPKHFSEEEKSDDLDFTEKIRAFRSLVSPKPRISRHDISNEQLKKARSFADGIEQVGDHVKFSAKSSDHSKIRSTTPSRLLNEFQLTYEQDREREKENNSHGFLKDHPFLTRRETIKSMKDNPVNDSSGQSALPSDPSAAEDFYEHTTPVTPFRKDAKRIIRRPTNPSSSGEYEHVHSSFGNQNFQPQHSSVHTYDVSQDVSRFRKPIGAVESALYSGKGSSLAESSGTLYAARSKNTEMVNEIHARDYKRTMSFAPTEGIHHEVTSRPSMQVARPSSVAALEDPVCRRRNLSPSDRSQSVTPTLGSLHSNIGPSSVSSSLSADRGFLEPGSSLKAHLNVLGASLSSLSSRLNGGSQSDIRSLCGETDRSGLSSSSVTVGSVRTGRKEDNGILNDRSIRQSGHSPFDVSGVRVALRDGHHLQTWSSSSDMRAETWPGDDLLSKRSSVSGSVTATSERSSMLGVRDDSKQTNVQVYASDDDLKSESGAHSRKSAIRSCHGESPRQANVDSSSSPVTSKRTRTEKLRKVVKYVSRHKDTLEKYKREESKQSITGAKGENSSHGRHGRFKNNDNLDTFHDSYEGEYMSESDTLASGSEDETLETVSERLVHSSSKSSLQRSPRHGGFSRTGGDETNTVRVISRKVPLKAVHPDSPHKRDGSKTNIHGIFHDRSIHSAGAKDSKKQNIDHKKETDEKRKLVVKRPREGYAEKRNTSRKTAYNATTEKDKLDYQVVRSKSALGLSSSTLDSKSSHLPSRNKLGDFQCDRRSHSSLDTLNSGPGSRRHQSKSVASSNVSEADRVSVANKSAVLKDKVQKLHDEVNRRLNSKENLAHNASTYGLRNDSDDTDIEENGDEESDASTIVDDGSGDAENYVNSKRKSKNSESFITSTPLKNKSNKLNSQNGTNNSVKLTNKHLSESFDNNEDKHDDEILKYSKNSLAHNLKKIIAAKNRLTPDLMSLRSSKVDGDDDADDDKDELDPNLRRRPGSVGAPALFEPNKKDILSRILSKMSANTLSGSSWSSSTSLTFHTVNGHQNGGKWIFQQNGVNLPGRASPAESLLSHLDNPQMVKLLKKLYKADPDTRHKIMVKVQFFKTWQQYAISSREQRRRKETLNKSASAFCVHRLLLYHFVTWERQATDNSNMRRATAMFRRHMLTKGFKALQWSISQSKHQSQKLQAKVHGIMLKVTFRKWRTKAETQRRERIMNAMTRWRQFVTETQKIHHMQQVMDTNIMIDVLRCWKKRFNRRMKLNMAFSFLRGTLLKHAMNLWCGFVAQCKEKKEKFATAVTQHQQKLLHSTFFTMMISYKKSRKARNHFRCHRLSEVFWAWKEAIQICRAERQSDMAASKEHWERQKIKHGFTHWRERLKICRAGKKADFNMIRNAFVVWRQAWYTNMAQREAIESTVMHNKLHRALLTWRQNVVQLKRQHKAAVSLIENCHLRQTFRVWRLYTAQRGILKKKALLHRIAHQRKVLVTCFSQWHELFMHRQKLEQVKQLWSEACARKIASSWRLICRKRFLVRLLEETQPAREQKQMKALFTYWMNSLEKRNKEKEKADDLQTSLERRQLQLKFLYWRAETQRALKIKPMVLRRERQFLSESFQGWLNFVQQKSRCKQSKAALQQEMLRRSFKSWKRQYRLCQVAKQVQLQISQGLLLCSLEEWHFLILRKRTSWEFRNRQLVSRMFHYWQNRATVQFTYRARMEEEQKTNLELKRWCFVSWWENVQAQVSQTDQSVQQFVDRQSEAKLANAFVVWRRHMHSTLIARAYQKTQSHRLMLTLFCAWRDIAHQSVSDAVQKFSERIGLVSETGKQRRLTSGIGTCDDTYDESEGERSLMSSWNSSTFSMGSSTRRANESEVAPDDFELQKFVTILRLRLFGEDELNLEMDVDRMILLSGGLQASVDHHHARCQRLKEVASRAINRLQNWPICVAFEQWKEFTIQERQLKMAVKQLKELHIMTELRIAFRIWKSSFQGIRKAKTHWNSCLLSSSLQALLVYKNHRKYVKHLNQKASQHHMLVVFSKCFPPWLQKTQDQRQEKHILDLWTSRTAREMELFPLESQLTWKMCQKSLTLCFSVWLVKYQGAAKIRKIYHDSISKWVFSAWREWAHDRHIVRSQSDDFLYRRRTRLVFCKWHERLRQKQETEKRYHLAWQNYLLLIMQQWKIWTRTSLRLHHCQELFEAQQSQRKLGSLFSQWKTLALKVKEIRSNQTQKLIYSAFTAWRQTVVKIRNEKQKILKFRVHSYTLLVKRLFHQWHMSFLECKVQQEKQKQQAEQCAVNMAAIWRRKAQRTRGQRLQALLQKRQLASYFQLWKTSLSNLEVLYDKLAVWTQTRNTDLVRQYLRTWRIELIADHARKVYTAKVLFTYVEEWRNFARLSKERRIRGLALQKALKERSLHVYFQYWVAMTKVKQNVQHNVETRLQMRILRAWRFYTQNTRYLRELQDHFAHRVNTRILHNAFQNLRWKWEYCASLQEISHKVVKDRERATIKAALVVWKDRLDKILAARCYGQILAVRTARQWQRFVHKNKQERQKDKENWDRAETFNQRKLCKKVLASLKVEVMVSKQVQKRRQRLCDKFAQMWKVRVDMAVTAVSMEHEILQKKMWKKWRMAYTRVHSSKKIMEQQDRQFLSQVFTGWRKLCCKQSFRASAPAATPDMRRTSVVASPSFLPVPVQQTRSPLPGAEMSFGFKGGRKS